jgi:phage baseplate assembly protein W
MNLHGSSIDFPIRADNRGTLVTTDRRPDVIAQAIADIIETRRGERVMMPDYGIPDFVFDVQDFSFSARLAFYLEEQITKYVPLVANVTAKAQTDDGGRATVALSYIEVGSVNAPRNLVFPVWQYIGGLT